MLHKKGLGIQEMEAREDSALSLYTFLENEAKMQ